MKRYLDKIKNNNHINYKVFLGLCIKNKIKEDILRNIFSINSCKCKSKNQYILTIKNEELFEKIFSTFFSKDKDKKVQAALQGNSKKAKNENSILIWKENFSDCNSIAISFKNKKYQLNLNKKKNLIIIENLNNFANIKSNFEENEINLEDYNFVLGMGNSITNNNFSDFLNEYENIVCLFDIDLGGLKFFKTLLKNIKTNQTFLLNDKMKEKILIYGKKIDIKQYNEVLKYKKEVPELNEITNFIIKHKKFAEQEIFQHHNNKEHK